MVNLISIYVVFYYDLWFVGEMFVGDICMFIIYFIDDVWCFCLMYKGFLFV